MIKTIVNRVKMINAIKMNKMNRMITMIKGGEAQAITRKKASHASAATTRALASGHST